MASSEFTGFKFRVLDALAHCALRKSFHFMPFREPAVSAALYFALHSFILSALAGAGASIRANAPKSSSHDMSQHRFTPQFRFRPGKVAASRRILNQPEGDR